MGAARGVAPSLAPRPAPSRAASSARSTPGDKVHARGAPNTRGPRVGRLGVIWVLFCFAFAFVRILVFTGYFHPGEEGGRACSRDGL